MEATDKPDRYEHSNALHRLVIVERLMAHHTERRDNELKSQYDASEALKQRVVALESLARLDEAKIGELMTGLAEATKRLDEASKVVKVLKADVEKLKKEKV